MRDLILNYTERCNSRCATCNVWAIRSPKTLPMDVIRRLFVAKRLDGCTNLYLTGGEPFLLDQCVDIARAWAAAFPGAQISGATNALSPYAYLERIQAMAKYAPVVPSVSVNGPRDIHDNTRGVAGSYLKAIQMMELLKAAAIPFNLAYLNTRSDNSEDAWAHVELLARHYGVGIVVTDQRWALRYHNHAEHPLEYDGFDCPAMRDMLTVWPDGRVTACEQDDAWLEAGNLYEHDLDHLPGWAAVEDYVNDRQCQPCSMLCFYARKDL